MDAKTDTGRPMDGVAETTGWFVGLGMVTMVLFPFALPGIALAVVAVLPLALLALPVALVAAPILAVRGLRRRAEARRAHAVEAERAAAHTGWAGSPSGSVRRAS